MPKIQFTEEFRQEAIRQIVDRGRPVAEVSAALGVSTHSLYAWLKEFKKPVEVTVMPFVVWHLFDAILLSYGDWTVCS
jgi:hypothetical protein